MTLITFRQNGDADLAEHPAFFDEHVTLLGQVKLTSPLTGKTVSLQERQMEVMRSKYAALELRMSELTRIAEDNAAIANRFHGWTQDLLRANDAADMPRALISGLQANFNVPQATLRLWEVADSHSNHWFAQGVSDDARIFANSLRAPYCGSNHDFEAVRCLDVDPFEPLGIGAPTCHFLDAACPARHTAGRDGSSPPPGW